MFLQSGLLQCCSNHEKASPWSPEGRDGAAILNFEDGGSSAIEIKIHAPSRSSDGMWTCEDCQIIGAFGSSDPTQCHWGDYEVSPPRTSTLHTTSSPLIAPELAGKSRSLLGACAS